MQIWTWLPDTLSAERFLILGSAAPIKRAIVPDTTADTLIAAITAKVVKLKVGSPEEEADIVPLIDDNSANFVVSLIEDALAKGAVAVTPYQRQGTLITPVVLDRVTRSMRVAWDEPFGPVLPIFRVQTEIEAIELINESEYGLQASVFTNSIDGAFSIASQLEVGTVQINGRTERGPDHFPFLGVKQSGLGAQGVHNSILSMTREKVVVLNL